MNRPSITLDQGSVIQHRKRAVIQYRERYKLCNLVGDTGVRVEIVNSAILPVLGEAD